MPWNVFAEDEKWCVYRLNADGERGELVACHDTEEDAQEQMAALYASENEADKSATPIAFGSRVKALGDGRVGGYLVVYGGPENRDLQGEYFTPETELALDWYDKRPALYHHGLDGKLKHKRVGVIDTLKEDTVGVWAEAQLAMHDEYVQAVYELTKRGVLGWSSGSKPNLVQVNNDGKILVWPIDEGSLTPSPAHPMLENDQVTTRVTTLKALQDVQGLPDLRGLIAAKEGEGDADNTPPEEVTPEATDKPPPDETVEEPPPEQPTDNPEEEVTMDEQMVNAIISAVAEELGVELTEEQQQAVLARLAEASQDMEETEDEAKIAEQRTEIASEAAKAIVKIMQDTKAAADEAAKAALKAMKDTPAKPKHTPYTGGDGNKNPANKGADIIVRSVKYGDMSPEDMSFLYSLNKARTQGSWRPDGEFISEFAGKTVELYNGHKLTIDARYIKSLKAMAAWAAAAKSDELDYSTQAGYGDEWVPDLWASELWRKARLDNVILPLFRSVEMPSNPYELPIEGSDPTVSFVPETTNEAHLLLSGAGNPIPDSKIGSGKVTLTAKKLALRVGFSQELVEDSIIPVIAIYREQAQRAIMDAIDNVLLNGDDTNAGTGNINSDDADPADTEKYLAMNGLRHSALVEDTARAIDGSGKAPDLAMLRSARFAMLTKYAQSVKNLAFITGGEVYAKLLSLDEFITMDKAGPNASAMTGQIGFIDGIPVLTSAEYGLTEADGKISDTAENNTLGQGLYVYRPNWYVGYKRKVNLTVDYLPYFDSYQLVASVRFAFAHFDNDSVGLLYNLAV